ncbi:MAG TPA: hypothetical protein VEL11_18765 [Candidatus Bathyarchaeia archaeon]|nr:hypothetical protein [Candidatus Bathyarchaeia archaeon]
MFFRIVQRNDEQPAIGNAIQQAATYILRCQELLAQLWHRIKELDVIFAPAAGNERCQPIYQRGRIKYLGRVKA